MTTLGVTAPGSTGTTIIQSGNFLDRLYNCNNSVFPLGCTSSSSWNTISFISILCLSLFGVLFHKDKGNRALRVNLGFFIGLVVISLAMMFAYWWAGSKNLSVSDVNKLHTLQYVDMGLKVVILGVLFTVVFPLSYKKYGLGGKQAIGGVKSVPNKVKKGKKGKKERFADGDDEDHVDGFADGDDEDHVDGFADGDDEDHVDGFADVDDEDHVDGFADVDDEDHVDGFADGDDEDHVDGFADVDDEDHVDGFADGDDEDHVDGFANAEDSD